MTDRKATLWYCINCDKVLGEVVGGEYHPDDSITGSFIATRGPNLVVKCPKCGSTKVWYTSDPIVRSIHQMIDSMVTVAASRMVREISMRTLKK